MSELRPSRNGPYSHSGMATFFAEQTCENHIENRFRTVASCQKFARDKHFVDVLIGNAKENANFENLISIYPFISLLCDKWIDKWLLND